MSSTLPKHLTISFIQGCPLYNPNPGQVHITGIVSAIRQDRAVRLSDYAFGVLVVAVQEKLLTKTEVADEMRVDFLPHLKMRSTRQSAGHPFLGPDGLPLEFDGTVLCGGSAVGVPTSSDLTFETLDTHDSYKTWLSSLLYTGGVPLDDATKKALRVYNKSKPKPAPQPSSSASSTPTKPRVSKPKTKDTKLSATKAVDSEGYDQEDDETEDDYIEADSTPLTAAKSSSAKRSSSLISNSSPSTPTPAPKAKTKAKAKAKNTTTSVDSDEGYDEVYDEIDSNSFGDDRLSDGDYGSSKKKGKGRKAAAARKKKNSTAGHRAPAKARTAPAAKTSKRTTTTASPDSTVPFPAEVQRLLSAAPWNCVCGSHRWSAVSTVPDTFPIACTKCFKLQHRGCVADILAKTGEVTYICAHCVNKANHKLAAEAAQAESSTNAMGHPTVGGKGPAAVAALSTPASGDEPVDDGMNEVVGKDEAAAPEV